MFMLLLLLPVPAAVLLMIPLLLLRGGVRYMAYDAQMRRSTSILGGANAFSDSKQQSRMRNQYQGSGFIIFLHIILFPFISAYVPTAFFN